MDLGKITDLQKDSKDLLLTLDGLDRGVNVNSR